MLIQCRVNKIKVVELFAGVGGFRIGLEGASDAYETIWNNQWEPSMVHRDRYVGSLVLRESLVPIPMIQCGYDSIAYNSVVGVFEQC